VQQETDTFTLALEVLFGCSFNCNGCLANTAPKRLPDQKELEFMFELLTGIGKKYRLQEIELAPTDFMTSNNRHLVVHNAGIQKLFTLFDNVELNTTLLYPHRDTYKEMAEDIETMNPGGGLGLIVPFELKHINNYKYLDTFRKHLQWLEEAMGRPIPEFEISFTVGFDQILAFSYRYDIEKLWDLYDSFMRAKLHPNASFHFNISNSRGFLNNPQERKDAKKVIETLNRLYVLDLLRHPSGWREDAKSYHMHINPHLKMHHYAGNELYWTEGKLYHTPALYKNIELEEDQFLFKGKNITDYYEDVMRLNFESLEAAGRNEDCNVCPHVMNCSQKHTQLLSEKLEINNCIFKEKLA
jgi:hypothetical protein